MASQLNRYVASMVLSGSADALGYKNAGWEFCFSGEEIHKQLADIGGLESIVLCRPKWMLSDDTIMHLATGEALVEHAFNPDKESLYSLIAVKYKECMNDMTHRGPGLTSSTQVRCLRPSVPEGYQIPFDGRGGGCGAAMRAMCIGLRYPRPEDLDDLIAVSIESGRMTHHHPTGFLGALASALFTHYAVQDKPVESWGAGLLSVLPKALEYVESQQRYVVENKLSWPYFSDSWTNYLKLREITDGNTVPKFNEHFGVKERDEFYKSLSFDGWGGASGHDAPIIAYDALLGCKGSWTELCHRGILHGGDNDSTGAIAGAWFGAVYGFEGVPLGHHEKLEYRERLEGVAEKLFELSHPSTT